ncbi:MAG TPA: radical SAM protein [Geobacteraceae bacterium]
MRCSYCERRCRLGEDSFGLCGMYYAKDGEIRERYPNRWSGYTVSRIESIPFYHAYPGSRTLAVGTFGCNFRCRYCSNGFIALDDPGKNEDRMFHLTPSALVATAKKLGCHNMVFNVNEPAVSLPTLMGVAVEARKAGIPMGCLTNGYTTEESTELLASIFSFVNIGLKGFSDAFYREYTGIRDLTPVLRNIRLLAERCHLEVITPVIHGANDDRLDEMARFLAGINKHIPWHVFRLLPEHEMKESEYPSIEGINRALDTARKELDHIYFHNFVGSDWVDTACPACGTVVIERFSLGCGGDRLNTFLCRENSCPACGEEILLLGTSASGHEREAA